MINKFDSPDEVRKALHRRKYNYDIKKYPFKEILENIFGVDLENIHNWLGDFSVFNKDTDQNTIIHKVFYANFDEKISSLYKHFIENEIANFIPSDFYYQLVPTFRVGLPGNKFVGEYHKDSNYNHQDYELNINLGLSNYFGDASLKAETEPNSNIFTSLECPYGQIFSFDHINCLHGCETNSTNKTMISFDFRLALSNFYFESSAKSVTIGRGFKTGSYFSKEIVKTNLENYKK